ncbi:MAG TPA: hypothetical protein VGF30_13925 [Bacteroidia bacterium]
MKTIKKIVIAGLLVTITTCAINLSKNNFNRIKPCLKESTHQGYRTFVADYIF